MNINLLPLYMQNFLFWLKCPFFKICNLYALTCRIEYFHFIFVQGKSTNLKALWHIFLSTIAKFCVSSNVALLCIEKEDGCFSPLTFIPVKSLSLSLSLLFFVYIVFFSWWSGSSTKTWQKKEPIRNISRSLEMVSNM